MNWAQVKKSLTHWQVEVGSVEELKKAQVIVTQCTELLPDGTAGPANTLIAEHANRLHERFKLPIITQPEILVAKPNLPALAVSTHATTRAICEEQKKICDEHGYKNILVVTFPDHFWRVCEIYKKLGLNPIPAVMMGNPNIYYHKNARRWQMRNRFRFKYFWEIPTRLRSLKKGWM